MPNRPQSHSSDASHNSDKKIENKAGEKSALDPQIAEKSQADAKGMATIESQRTNRHDGSAGGTDNAESVTIEALDNDGNKHKVSRLDGGTEKDLDFNRDRPMPLGGYKEVHRPDGGITLSGVIPGTDTELENITTDTMQALAPENKLVENALTMRRQIEQHMQPGPDRDRAINQLKSDVTASFFGVTNDSSGAEDAGVHRALLPEITPISVFDKISKLPINKQAQIIGAGIEAFQTELGEQGSEIWLGTQKGVNKSVMGMIDDVVGLGETVGKIWQFGQDIMTNNPRALETSAQAGEAIGGAMVSGVKLWGVTEKYLGEVGATGDYGKPLRDLSILSAEINRRWQVLTPGEKAEVASELLTNIAVPGAMAKISKSARIVERLEDLTDTLKKLKPEDKQAFCQKFGEFLDRLFPNPRQGGLRPAYATAGEGNSITNEIKDENAFFSHRHKSDKDDFISEHSQGDAYHKTKRLEGRQEVSSPSDREESTIRKNIEIAEAFQRRKINEVLDHPDVIQQFHKNACVCACGEMLTEGRRNQREIFQELLEYLPSSMRSETRPISLQFLGDELEGFRFDSFIKGNLENLDEAFKQTSPWAAELKATGYDAHIVIVEKITESGNVLIKDPANKSMYEMTKNHFKDYWNGRAVKRDSL